MMKQVSNRYFCQIVSAVALTVFLAASFALAQDDSQSASADQASIAQSAQSPVDEASAETAPDTEPATAEDSTSAEDVPSTDELTLDGDSADIEISQSDITVTPVPQAKKLQLGGSIIFATVIGIFLVAWLLANFFAKIWRMQDYRGKYFIVIFCFLLALFSTIYGLLGHRLNLRYTPEIIYKDDDSIAHGARINELLHREAKPDAE